MIGADNRLKAIELHIRIEKMYTELCSELCCYIGATPECAVDHVAEEGLSPHRTCF